MRFTGQIAFDFIEESDGTIRAIECNPRATSGITLFDVTGDLPIAFFGVEQPVRFPQTGRRTRARGVMLKAGSAQRDGSGDVRYRVECGSCRLDRRAILARGPPRRHI